MQSAIQFWFGEFKIRWTKFPIDNFLYSLPLSAWYCIDTVRRNSLGHSWRLKGWDKQWMIIMNSKGRDWSLILYKQVWITQDFITCIKSTFQLSITKPQQSQSQWTSRIVGKYTKIHQGLINTVPFSSNLLSKCHSEGNGRPSFQDADFSQPTNHSTPLHCQS